MAALEAPQRHPFPQLLPHHALWMVEGTRHITITHKGAVFFSHRGNRLMKEVMELLFLCKAESLRSSHTARLDEAAMPLVP